MDTLKEYFSFKGRINRAKYFGIALVAGLIVGILNRIVISMDSSIAMIITYAIMLVYYALTICLVVRRFHDIERPGTHFWFLLIPLYNIYLGFVLLLKPGTEGPNEYGEDPLGIKAEA